MNEGELTVTIIALAVWTLIQTTRMGSLRGRVDKLEWTLRYSGIHIQSGEEVERLKEIMDRELDGNH
jgi:hypothetical protein